MPTPSTRTRLVIILALALGAFVLLACGSGSPSATLVSTAVPAGGSSAKPTAVAAQSEQPTAAASADQPTAAASADQPTSAPAEEQPTAAPANQEFKIGDVIHINELNLAVIGWEELKPTDLAKPEAGKKFIAVELVFVNTGKDAAHVSSLAQMKLKDDTAQQYDADFMASMAVGSKAPDGEIAAGEKLRGKVGFAVPVEAKGLQYVFDASLFSSGKVFVSLGDAPDSVEAPAEMAGEAPQKLYNVGDAIQIGDIVLTVNEVKTPKASQIAKPEKGKRFLVVDLTLENKATKAANLSSMLQMQLKDASGQAYGSDLMASMASGGKAPDGELAPGEKIKGQVGFQVPEDAKDLTFVFDGDIFGAGKVFVKLP
jgi:hypothetical protein